MVSIFNVPPVDEAVHEARTALRWAGRSDLDSFEAHTVAKAAAELVEAVESAREHREVRLLNEGGERR